MKMSALLGLIILGDVTEKNYPASVTTPKVAKAS
jgi:hypothetical protein